ARYRGAGDRGAHPPLGALRRAVRRRRLQDQGHHGAPGQAAELPAPRPALRALVRRAGQWRRPARRHGPAGAGRLGRRRARRHGPPGHQHRRGRPGVRRGAARGVLRRGRHRAARGRLRPRAL
ncbi:MAG: Mannose-1-phosphate guanylyltransferase (GDP), partial [uncultured Frankineae bacterium]